MALPILFSGVQKAGTTTMFSDLHKSLWLRRDFECDQPGRFEGHFYHFQWQCKELHWFDAKSTEADRRYDLLWGSCRSPKTGVIADFTPANFYYPYIPKRLRAVYGKKASREIVFSLGLREPLRRMLAAFAHGLSAGWLYQHSRQKLRFQEHVSEFLQQWDENGRASWIPTLWKTKNYRTVDQGLYYYKIRNYLKAGFLPSQFVIFPGSLYLDHRGDLDKNPVLEALREKIGGRALRPKTYIDEATVSNAGHHGSVSDELTDEFLRARLDSEVFGPANTLLMQLLAEGVGQGMVLVGYSGEV